MLKWLDFKPKKMSLRIWAEAYFNYYIMLKLKRNLYSDSHNLIVKAKVEDMALMDPDNRYEKRIMKLDPKSYRTDPLTKDNFDNLIKDLFPWERRKFTKYLRNGSYGHLSKIRNDMVCCTWVSHGNIDPEVKKALGLEIELGKNDVWGVDIIVHPDYRGQGFEFIIFKHTPEYLLPQGVENVWGAVWIGDKGSLKMHKRVGFKPIYFHYDKRRFGVRTSTIIPVNKDTVDSINKIAAKYGIDITSIWKDIS